jgi:hypothetical protein
MVYLRFLFVLACISLATGSNAQMALLPDAPLPSASLLAASSFIPDAVGYSSSAAPAASSGWTGHAGPAPSGQSAEESSHGGPRPRAGVAVDDKGNPIPLNRQEPQRILGFMPNFRSVSGGAKPPPPGWKYNFTVATHQATDYSSFIFLGITSLTAEGMDAHPVLGKGAAGFYAYSWRGFLDKTDNTYLSAWLLPSLLHEDTRYYALGAGHSIPVRSLYVIGQQAVARTYGGRLTPNVAGLGGKVLTQVFSRYYYPPSATSFNALATKFSYSVMRDVAFSSIREFYPDAAAHFIRKHREKMARLAAKGAATHP